MDSQTTIESVYSNEWKTYWFHRLACPVFDKYKHNLETFRVFVPPNVKNVELQIKEIMKTFNDNEIMDISEKVYFQPIHECTKHVTVIFSKFDITQPSDHNHFMNMWSLECLDIVPNIDYVSDACLQECCYDNFEDIDETQYENNENRYVAQRITGLLLMTICDFYTNATNYGFYTSLPNRESVFANDYITNHITKY